MGMAKRNYSKRSSSKIEPAVQTLTFVTPSTTAGAIGAHTIDLSQVASLINRRFYRQGINWAVAGFKIFGAAPGAIAIQKLPNTWVLSNSWEKSMRAWSKMNRKALEETPSVRPKFLDFKIYADNLHHSAGFGANLLPRDSALNAAVAGEWEPSKFIVPDSASATGAAYSREVIAVGINYPGAGASGLNAISMIEGYAASRGLPDVLDPNAPADSADADGPTPQNWLTALFNEGTQQDDEVLDDMVSENNLAPYPFENDGVHVDTMYPGGANQLPALQTHDQASITNTTIGGTTMMKGGNFPCGLVRIQHAPQETSNLVIQVDLIPGNHRGYLCEPMTEM
jgi:hypothetical protein